MKIMGHRGARGERPENTLQGIEYALNCGVDGIEIDIHQSLDGELVVIHDDTLERTTNGEGLVAQKTWSELKKYDAGEGSSLCLLDDVLDLVMKHEKWLFIEIKAAGLEEKLLKTLSQKARTELIILKCFHHRWLKEFKQRAPNYKTAALMHGLPVDPVGLARSCSADMLSLSVQTVDALCVQQAHEGGVEVCAWNCNEPREIKKYREMGLDWLGTDYPSRIVRLQTP